MNARKVFCATLGCDKNLVDSEIMLGELRQEGFALTGNAREADVVIVNTCGFIDKAKEESVGAILEMAALKKEGKLHKLIVSGCLSQRYHSEMAAEMPEVDLFLGTNHVGRIRQFLSDLHGERPLDEATDWRPEFLYSSENERVLTAPGHSAYVKISEGCDHLCSFCIIPTLRGRYRSRPIEDIKREVAGLAEQGIREVNLVAQDSTFYGRDLGLTDGLAQLLEALVEVTRISWIRVHYMYPYQVSDRLLAIMNQHPKLCNYLDMPLQHADRKILAAMKRGSGRKQLEQFLARIRRGVPDAMLRSSFIVGFPGEDDRAFNELCRFVTGQALHHLGVFTYSHEEGTTAYALDDSVAGEVKEERKLRLLEIQQEVSRKKLAQNIGKTFDVLVEGVHPETELLLRGRHQGQAPEVDGEVFVTEGTWQPGDIIPVTIEETFDYDMAGRVMGGMEV